MARPITITPEEEQDYYEAYKKYGSFDRAARILQVPRWKIVNSTYRLENKCRCSRPLEPGQMCCSICQERARERKNTTYTRRKSAHQCVTCGSPDLDPRSQVYCVAHREISLEKQALKRKEYRELGLCPLCGKELDSDDPTYCAKHAPKQRQHFRNNRNRRNYSGLYEDVLERDNHKCVICGEDEPRVEVHHKQKTGPNTLENLDTLCSHCHHAVTQLYACPYPQLALDYVLKNPQV